MLKMFLVLNKRSRNPQIHVLLTHECTCLYIMELSAASHTPAKHGMVFMTHKALSHLEKQGSDPDQVLREKLPLMDPGLHHATALHFT